MNTKKTLRINLERLPESIRIRFGQILEVAAPRSIVQWQLTSERDSDVVAAVDALGPECQTALCIQLADETALPIPDAVRLQSDFRVSSVITALDLAAVKVLNGWDARGKDLHGSSAGVGVRYRLKHWVANPGTVKDPGQARALAAMTRRAISRPNLAARSGMNLQQVDALLRELQFRGVLDVSESSGQTQLAALSAAPTAPPGLKGGFLGRLKQWLASTRPSVEPSTP